MKVVTAKVVAGRIVIEGEPLEESDGATPLCANLTNLAAWRADGTISSDEELKRDWLLIRVP
jgi:hypothetical protein